MLSHEQLLALVALLLRRGRLSQTTRDTLEQYLAGEQARQILKAASDVKYFIMPQPVGRIGVPVVTPTEPPDDMNAQDAQEFRNHSITHKTAKYVVYVVRKRGINQKRADEGSEMEKILEALVTMISEFLRKRDGTKCNPMKWSYVLDLLSTPRREMETLLRGIPQSAARDDAIEALDLPKTVRKAFKKKASDDKEENTEVQPAKRKRKTAKGGQKPRKKASKAKKRSKASASDNDTDDGDATSDPDNPDAMDDESGSPRAPDPLGPIFIYDFPSGAYRMRTPSRRLLCGLVALIDSIRHHHQDIPIPTVPQLEALVAVLGIQDAGDFDEVQLGRILSAWGRIHRRVLQLGYVVGTARSICMDLVSKKRITQLGYGSTTTMRRNRMTGCEITGLGTAVETVRTIRTTITSEATTTAVLCVGKERQRQRCKAFLSDIEVVDMNARGMQGVDSQGRTSMPLQ